MTIPTSFIQGAWKLGFQPLVMWFSYERYRLGLERSLKPLRVVPRKRVIQFLCREGSIASSSLNSACFFNRKTTFGRNFLRVFPIYTVRCIVGITTRPWSFRASLITENLVIFPLNIAGDWTWTVLYEPQPSATITFFVPIHTTACKIGSTFYIGETAGYR